MIVAKPKPVEEVIESVSGFDRILLVGCNECVTVCEAGGRKEVGVLASALRMHFMNQGKSAQIDEETRGGQWRSPYRREDGRGISSQP